VAALLLVAGCTSGSHDKTPAPASTGASTTPAPFANGINGPVTPSDGGPVARP
jgi:hypothetical protein